MPRLTISPSAARRHALAWRVAAVALAAAAGALWAFQTPFGSADVAVEPGTMGPVVPPDHGPGPAPVTLAVLDTDAARGIQDRLDHAFDRPPRPEPDTQVGPQPQPAAIAAWRYLGSITTPRHRSAVVSVDARQYVIREGGVFRYSDSSGAEVEVMLVEVRPDFIIIDDGSGRRELKKEQRTGPAVAWVTAGMNVTPDQMQRRAEAESARAARAAATAMQAGVTAPGMSPEQQAMLRERGVSPASAAEARNRLDKLRNRARSRGAATIADPAGNTTTNTKDTTTDAPESNR